MTESEIQEFVLFLLKSYEKALIRFAALRNFLWQSGIQVSKNALDGYLKDHPEISEDIHRDCEPLFAAINENADFQSALEALRNMPVRGRIQ